MSKVNKKLVVFGIISVTVLVWLGLIAVLIVFLKKNSSSSSNNSSQKSSSSSSSSYGSNSLTTLSYICNIVLPTQGLYNSLTSWITNPGGVVTTPPSSTNDVVFSLQNSYLIAGIGSSSKNLYIGYHTTGCTLSIPDGSTFSAAATVYIGRYPDASGAQIQTSGRGTLSALAVQIGSAGQGSLIMHDNSSCIITTSLILDYYYTTSPIEQAPNPSSYIKLWDSSLLSCQTLTMNPNTYIQFSNYGMLSISGNVVTAMTTYQKAGYFKVYSATDVLQIIYNSTLVQTQIYVTSTRETKIKTLTDYKPLYNYNGVTQPIAVSSDPTSHPRIYMSPEDLPGLYTRLTTLNYGKELYTMITLISGMLTGGFPWYNAQPSSLKTLASGSPRLTNAGVYDQSANYAALLAGKTTPLTGTATTTIGFALAASMACEAFQCMVERFGNPNYATSITTRATNLATAMTVWNTYSLTRSDFQWLAGNNIAGGPNMVLCYDFNYWAMTPAQRTTARQVIARMAPEGYSGIDIPAPLAGGNWVTLDSFLRMLPLMAIEGEVEYTPAMQQIFIEIMECFVQFLNFSILKTGSTKEGLGKNQIAVTSLIAFAKRGWDFLGHQFIYKHLSQYYPQILNSWGFGANEYDDTPIGYLGDEENYWYKWYNVIDYVGGKWLYPTDPNIDFVWSNFINSRYASATSSTNNTSTITSGRVGLIKTTITPVSTTTTPIWLTCLSATETKIGLRAGFNALLLTSIFVQDPITPVSTISNAVASLSYFDLENATMIARSDLTSTALRVQTHIKQDFGGHRSQDNGAIIDLQCFGRIWVKYQPFASNQSAIYQSVQLVNGMGSGQVPNNSIPFSKCAGWMDSPLATFISGDHTYAYSNKWEWSQTTSPDGKTVPTNPSPSIGWFAETHSFNDFRRSNNKLDPTFWPNNSADAPIWSLPWWNNNYAIPPFPPAICNMQVQPYNSCEKVYRTTGLIRGPNPYVLVLDSMRKATGTLANYTFRLQLPIDLTVSILTTSTGTLGGLPGDVILFEPQTPEGKPSNRRLLIRALVSTGVYSSPVLITDTASGNNRNRLDITRSQVQDEDSAYILYPFLATSSTLPAEQIQLPILTVEACAPGRVILNFQPTQVDTWDFYPNTEFVFYRNGTTIMDYRTQFESLGFSSSNLGLSVASKVFKAPKDPLKSKNLASRIQ